MVEMIQKRGRILFVSGILMLAPILALAQDELGSGGGLFKNPSAKKPAGASKPVAKAKPKTVAKSVPAKKISPRESSSKTPAVSQKPRAVAKNTSDIKKTPTTPTIRTEVAINKNNSKPPVTNAEDQFEGFLAEGNTARDARNYLAAESAYRRAQGVKAKDARAVYGLGNLYSDQQRWDSAEKAYRDAIRLDPNNSDAYIALSFVLIQPVGGTNSADRYVEAERMARKAITFDARNPIAYDQLGLALELRGVINDETQSAYRKAIELDSNYALPYAHLGKLMRRNGLIPEAKEAYNKAIQLAADAPTMVLVAEVLQAEQKFSESENLLVRALQSDPKNPMALYFRGRALLASKRYEEAERIFLDGIKVSPNSFGFYASLGSVYLRQSRFSDAEKIFVKAIQIASPPEKTTVAGSEGLTGVGDGYLRLRKKDDAVRVFRKALELDNGNAVISEKLIRAQKINK